MRPVFGRLRVEKIDGETLESFYATLRKRGSRCGGRRFVEHRKPGSLEELEQMDTAELEALVAEGRKRRLQAVRESSPIAESVRPTDS